MLRALVIGGSADAMAEAEAALKLFQPDAIVLINDMIPKWPGRADYVCTLHPEKLADWITKRNKAGHPMGAEVWSHRAVGPKQAAIYRGVDKTLEDWAGSSGLFAVKVMLKEGMTKIVLAGCPMERNAGHFVRNKYWAAADCFRTSWLARRTFLTPYVRSMSGWTQTMLGKPTLGWLAEPIAPSSLAA